MAETGQQWPNSAITGLFANAMAYAVDAGQRSLLFWDIMRQRGNQFCEHEAEKVPHVLNYDVELVLDARSFDRPVNYLLVRIVPPDGVTIDPERRPFIVFDPRAGHGPGIGGFKADSEIGVALRAGHPCYFVGFLPEPMPGQTIEDIARAEAIFIEKVISLHPKCTEKPCVIGNCQAGWAIMILASLRPELLGPLIIAGAPLSYWAGVRGKNPMRYSGGVLGGSWLTALTSDLGAGKFDGGWLVQNFENMNPANTFWTKQYNVYSQVDTEGPRYLEFERWWGGHVNLNAEEIQFIVDELFVGNKLAAGLVKASDGTTIDFRNIRSPIVVFCSQGDDITPPQQALDWILDLYEDVDEIRNFGQTIVYTVHQSVGHLGIFVSGGVARKEHQEFSSNIDLIDLLPPGLYEATFERKSEGAASPDLIGGEWIMRCETRTLDDIRALGGNSAEDERRFATAARLSEINLAMYRTFVQPWIQQFVTPQMADAMRRLHPLRLQYELFSDKNPLMANVAQAAEEARKARKPVSADNPFLAAQKTMSEQIVKTLDAWKETRDSIVERLFLAIYGSPVLQAALGVRSDGDARRHPGRSLLHAELLKTRIAELRSKFDVGGLTEAVVRGLLYVAIPREAIDERGVAALRRVRLGEDQARMSVAAFKAMSREQFLLLLVDHQAAIEAIPRLLPDDIEQRRKGLAAIRNVLNASGTISGESAARLATIERLFERGPAQADRRPLPFAPSDETTKAAS